MNWHDVSPPEIAARQVAWERRQAVVRMLSLGFTQKSVADRLGISASRVQFLARRAYEHDAKARAPIAVWADKANATRGFISGAEAVAQARGT